MIPSFAISILSYAELAIGIGALILMYAAHMRGTLTPVFTKKIAIIFAFFSAGMMICKIFAGYLILRSNEGTQLLLPPHQSWDWFIRITASGIAFPFAMSLISAVVMYAAAIGTNKYFRGELFAQEDKYIFIFAAFVVGWPNFIVYLAAAAILTVLLSGVAALRHGTDTRIVLTDALLFAIPVALLLSHTLAPYLNLFTLGIIA